MDANLVRHDCYAAKQSFPLIEWEAWNTRPIEDKLKAELSEAVKMLDAYREVAIQCEIDAIRAGPEKGDSERLAKYVDAEAVKMRDAYRAVAIENHFQHEGESDIPFVTMQVDEEAKRIAKGEK